MWKKFINFIFPWDLEYGNSIEEIKQYNRLLTLVCMGYIIRGFLTEDQFENIIGHTVEHVAEREGILVNRDAEGKMLTVNFK